MRSSHACSRSWASLRAVASSPLIYVVRTIRAGNRRSASGKMATIGSKTQGEVAVDVDREKQDLKRTWLHRRSSEAHRNPSAASVVFTRNLPSTGGISRRAG
jgi:hypothetical protein